MPKIDYEALLFEAVDRLNDMIQGDDGQAWKEAERFVEKVSKITGKPPPCR